MSERDVLLIHGTKAFVLKPGSIVQAALADLALREKKLCDERADQMARYSFHRDHVRRAKSARHLLELAMNDRPRGESSRKYTTRLIYADEQLLRSALEVA